MIPREIQNRPKWPPGRVSKSGPGGFLELIHHAANLRIARVVLRCPGDDARRVLVLELKRIGHGGHLVRMAPQHLDFFRGFFLILILVLILVVCGG